MMDVSDGLAADLPRLVKASGVGAVVDAEAVPVSVAARRMGKGGEQRAEGEEQGGWGGAALEHALSDGEDFELLFSVSARKAEAFESGWRKRFRLECTAIGKVTKVAGEVDLVRNGKVVPMTAKGYEHFRKL
jgi:thiamine-monophosphate kinase